MNSSCQLRCTTNAHRHANAHPLPTCPMPRTHHPCECTNVHPMAACPTPTCQRTTPRPCPRQHIMLRTMSSLSIIIHVLFLPWHCTFILHRYHCFCSQTVLKISHYHHSFHLIATLDLWIRTQRD